MENRQPTYPGRVVLTPVPGAANTYDMIRADDPTVEGTPLNKETLLQDATCAILDIPDTSVPNDAFVKLALGIGKYGYVIHVQYPDGSPAEGFTLTGLNAPDEAPAVTNANGDAVGVSTEQSVTVGVRSPYINVDGASSVAIQSTGLLTNYTFTVSRKDTVLIQSGGNISISPDVATYDLCAIGAGGGGNEETDGGNGGGSGGGGGYVQNLMSVSRTVYPQLSITIGAGGSPGRHGVSGNGGNGGNTVISSNRKTILQAHGGNGATTISSSKTQPGTGNGNGGYGIISHSPNSSSRDTCAGKPGSGYLFNDSSLGVPGGGGGSGLWGDLDATHADPISGGAPNGASGGALPNRSAGTAGIGGGGGGGRSSAEPSLASKGGNGAVYIRFHYINEVTA